MIKHILLLTTLVLLGGCAVYPYTSHVVYVPPPVVYVPPPVMGYGFRPAYRPYYYRYWR
jgi:hypothetical protein